MLDNRLLGPSQNDFRSFNLKPAVEGAPPVAGARPVTLGKEMNIIRFSLGTIAAALIWYAFENEKEIMTYCIAGFSCSALASYLSLQQGIKKRSAPLVFSSPFLISFILTVVMSSKSFYEISVFWTASTITAFTLNLLSDELAFRTIIEEEENT